VSALGRIAILGPTTLLGQELRNLLGRRKELRGRITLLAASEEEVGAVTEAGGAAALVSPAEPGALQGVDVVFSCGAAARDLPVLRARPEGATAILLSPDATAEDGVPVVAGVNPEAARRGEVLVSPHPAAIALAHLLAPLAGLGLESAAATTVQPVSMLGSRGLDDLLGQARDLLTMSGDRRESVFDRQLAFNLYPAPEGSHALAALVRRATGLDLSLAVHTLQGAVFHGLSVSLFVRFGDDPGEDAVRRALAERKHLRLSEADAAPGDVPGPIDAAAEDDLLVGSVRADAGHPGGYWVWAVMDNLTRGGATNAVEIAEACKVFTQ
jgi:aspartate-semialdehyde dehydrogenase